ncbi:MAG: hypothetical protein AAFZ52_14985, partial [Bacteroidota bacterium]
MDNGLSTYDRYFRANDFQDGPAKLLASLDLTKAAYTADQAREIIDYFRLRMLATAYVEVERRLAENGLARRIRLASPLCAFEVDLLEARIAYRNGYYHRAYNLCEVLLRRVEAHAQIDLSGKAAINTTFFRARITTVAGKALHRASDHAMARVYYGLALDYLGQMNSEDFTENFHLFARRLVLLARTYSDFPDELKRVRQLLQLARQLYDKWFAIDSRKTPSARLHLMYMEIEELEAYVTIEEKRNGRYFPYLHGKQPWFKKTHDHLERAWQIVASVLGKEPTSRSAHIFNLRARASLLQAENSYRLS